MTTSSVGCACDPQVVRGVEPIGDVNACMRCGAVTVSDANWDEPHPHVVIVLGYSFVDVGPELLAWLAKWPRVIWAGGAVPRCFLPSTLRANDEAALEAIELADRREQTALSYAGRLRRAGVPSAPPPATLPKRLESFSLVWSALQLDDQTPLDTLIDQATGWGGSIVDEVFLRRPTHAQDLLSLLRDPDTARREVGYGIVERGRLAGRPIIDALELRLEATDHGPQELHRLLIAIAALARDARELAPALRAVAERAKGDYSQHKRLTELATSVERRDSR
jgi:hypothetical protein